MDRGIDEAWWGPAPAAGADDDSPALPPTRMSMPCSARPASPRPTCCPSSTTRRQPRPAPRPGRRATRHDAAHPQNPRARPAPNGAAADAHRDPGRTGPGVRRRAAATSIPGSASPPTGPPTWATDGAPAAIRLGLVGPRDQLDGIRRWIERCRRPIDAKDNKYPHLFPGFPGCDSSTGLCTTLTIADRNCRELPSRELDRATGLPGELAVQAMIEVYMSELEALAEGNRADVIIVARPDTLDDVRLAAQTTSVADQPTRTRGRGAGSGAKP